MTLATPFVPGTNLKGKLAGNWTFLLPSLELESMLCLGVPSQPGLETFERISDRVVVADGDAQGLQTVDKNDWPSVETVLLNGKPTVPLADNSVDLVYVGSRYDVTKRSAWLSELRRVLRPEGLLYFEHGGPMVQEQLSTVTDTVASRLGRPNLYWVTPMMGEMETAVPANDKAIINYFIKNNLYSPAITLPRRVPVVGPALEKTERYIWKNRKLHKRVQRFGVLVGPEGQELSQKMPQYLHDALAKVGLNGDDYRWGILARGLYRTRKVIFFLFDQAADEPKIVVKMTRGANANYRLENEFRGLGEMRDQQLGDAEVIPQPVFLDHHGGLALMGQTVIEGDPFKKRTNHTADCPYVTIALNWLVDLSVKTRQPVPARDAAAALDQLYDHYKAIYKPNPTRKAFLDKQMATLREGMAEFPLVFQHGDPGTWNILITENGRPAFLDWEASEPHGMPLWDLYYFLRSYAVGASRTKGARNVLAGFEQQFLEESPYTPLIVEWVKKYCEAVNLPADYVEPLFYTCWMHRALKQASRMTEQTVDRGHYIKLLRLCVDRRDAPTLRQLFDA
ncbi:MAG: phosphotransferase [Chloroflexota bacterium]